MESRLVIAALLLMLLAILVLILVLVEGRKKDKKKNKETIVSAPVKTVSKPVKPMVYNPVENQSSGSIYAYVQRKSVRRCPECDGENALSCWRCTICGCEMGPMGR